MAHAHLNNTLSSDSANRNIAAAARLTRAAAEDIHSAAVDAICLWALTDRETVMVSRRLTQIRQLCDAIERNLVEA